MIDWIKKLFGKKEPVTYRSDQERRYAAFLDKNDRKSASTSGTYSSPYPDTSATDMLLLHSSIVNSSQMAGASQHYSSGVDYGCGSSSSSSSSDSGSSYSDSSSSSSCDSGGSL